MTAIPNQHWGGENHTSVSRFVTSIVALHNGYLSTTAIREFNGNDNGDGYENVT